MQRLLVTIFDNDIEDLDCKEFADEISDKFIGGANVDVTHIKEAYWIKAKPKFLQYMPYIYECSNCHNTLDFKGVNAGRGNANWCPNCGAIIVGSKER